MFFINFMIVCWKEHLLISMSATGESRDGKDVVVFAVSSTMIKSALVECLLSCPPTARHLEYFFMG